MSIALARWKNEYEHVLTEEEKSIAAMHTDDIQHCLLAFRVNHVERTSLDLHTAPKPITGYFLADVTLTLTPRPQTSDTLESMRANAVDTEIVDRRYHVKHFTDGDWLLMAQELLGD